MAYTTNPAMPMVRRKAVNMLREGTAMHVVARHFGFHRTSIYRWNKRASANSRCSIPTISSRPKCSPARLKHEITSRIIYFRQKHKRCALVTHYYLKKEGTNVSISSVQRTLRRFNLTKKKSLWARTRQNSKRPKVFALGDLIETDTIHLWNPVTQKRKYIYTLIDLHSRWTYAKAVNKIGAKVSSNFIKEAQKHAPFKFKTIQSDNGPEYSKYFTQSMKLKGLIHRHTRVRTPNDNAHIERFNRTIKEEALVNIPHKIPILNKKIKQYLKSYNNERPHLSLNFQSPIQFMLQSS